MEKMQNCPVSMQADFIAVSREMSPLSDLASFLSQSCVWSGQEEAEPVLLLWLLPGGGRMSRAESSRAHLQTPAQEPPPLGFLQCMGVGTFCAVFGAPKHLFLARKQRKAV